MKSKCVGAFDRARRKMRTASALRTTVAVLKAEGSGVSMWARFAAIIATYGLRLGTGLDSNSQMTRHSFCLCAAPPDFTTAD